MVPASIRVELLEGFLLKDYAQEKRAGDRDSQQRESTREAGSIARCIKGFGDVDSESRLAVD